VACRRERAAATGRKRRAANDEPASGPRPTAAPQSRPARGCGRVSRSSLNMQVFVRDNDVDFALKQLKRKLRREGVFQELKRRRAYS
jgi:hypothetical protein